MPRAVFSTTDEQRWGIKFVGTRGSVFSENTRLETHPAELLRVQIKASDERLHVSTHHQRNFIDCVVSRETTAAPAETAHRAAATCHLGAFAARLGRPLAFDPVTERFDDEEANALLTRPMRKPWSVT